MERTGSPGHYLCLQIKGSDSGLDFTPYTAPINRYIYKEVKIWAGDLTCARLWLIFGLKLNGPGGGKGKP